MADNTEDDFRRQWLSERIRYDKSKSRSGDVSNNRFKLQKAKLLLIQAQVSVPLILVSLAPQALVSSLTRTRIHFYVLRAQNISQQSQKTY